MTTAAAPLPLQDRWLQAWPVALERWSRYTQIRDPLFFATDKAARPYGMSGEIAAIRLIDQLVMVNLNQVQGRKLTEYALAILAHEIGHHIYVPGNLTDHARMLAAMKRVLFDLHPDTPHLVANFYGDLMINDRLQRRADVDICAVYKRFKELAPPSGASQVWMVYTRAYEHLWRLTPGTLAPDGVTGEMNADALLISRLIRHYAGEWLRGARRFAAILYPYLKEDEQARRTQTFRQLGLDDTKGAGRATGKGDDADAVPDGLTEIDPSELGDVDDFEDALADEFVEGEGAEEGSGKDRKGRARRQGAGKQLNTEPQKEGRGRKGNCREPFDYGELLKSLGLDLSQHEITTRYYRERALPNLIPFPSRKAPQAKEPLAEGYETWDAGEAIETLDVFGTLVQSPVLVPGITTVQRVYGETPGSDPAKTPIDLDIYIDSSGSMPNPAINISYLALAGAILGLSALRMGAKVQATLWSGAGQFETTGGFIRDEKRILGTLTGSINGGTAFPLNVLRETYRNRKPTDSPAHIVVISDDGVDTMFAKDDKGNQGEEIIQLALEKGRAGMTLALNLWNPKWAAGERFKKLGVRVHRCSTMEELVEFARAFVRENYE
ncbi:MAG: VWA domain-containing protein [Planctomycetes bacterium]|nr:VWA domain-containing protein [Planctomycetota bacterium]